MQTSRAKATIIVWFVSRWISRAHSQILLLSGHISTGESTKHTLMTFLQFYGKSQSWLLHPSIFIAYGCSNADAFVESHGLRMVVWSLTHIRWPSLTPELWDPNKDSGENTAGFQLEYSFHRYLASLLAFSQQYSGTAIVAQIKLRIGSTPSVATVTSFLLSY